MASFVITVDVIQEWTDCKNQQLGQDSADKTIPRSRFWQWSEARFPSHPFIPILPLPPLPPPSQASTNSRHPLWRCTTLSRFNFWVNKALGMIRPISPGPIPSYIRLQFQVSFHNSPNYQRIFPSKGSHTFI